MQFARPLIVLMLLVFAGRSAGASGSGSITPLFPEPQQCVAPKENLGLLKEDEESWSPCEKWAWSCIRAGKEANLFEKTSCRGPRSAESGNLAELYRYAAFYQPERYASANGLRGEFLWKLLTNPHYRAQTKPIGIRILGGYFAEPVDLENVTTRHNLVLDGSIFRRGLRLTNFRGEKNLSLDGANVRGDLLMLRLHIDGSLFLDNGVYDLINAHDARIDSSIDAISSVFNGKFWLDRAHVGGEIDLSNSWLTTLSARNATIGSSLVLRRTDVRRSIDVTGASVGSNVMMQHMWLSRERHTSGRACEWNLSGTNDYLLNVELDPKVREEILKETVLTRPVNTDGEFQEVCNPTKIAKEQGVAPGVDVLLRDMRISGTLCILDPSGRPAGPTQADALIGGTAEPYARISLDGAQSNSTVLHWDKSGWHTLWRAIHFKTGYMLMTLGDDPPWHEFDDVDVGYIVFTEHDEELEKKLENDDGKEFVDRELCDLDPAPFDSIALGSHKAHQGIIKFFNTRNRSNSTQPFTMLVERVRQFGTTSSTLDDALTEFKLSKWRVCHTSNNDLGKFRFVAGVMDDLCLAGQGTYKYFSWLKGSPRTIIFIVELIILSVALIIFFSILLSFDKRKLNHDGTKARRHGLVHAIDTFHPFTGFRFDKLQARRPPNRRWLRYYGVFHRFVGAILTVSILVLLYFAIK